MPGPIEREAKKAAEMQAAQQADIRRYDATLRSLSAFMSAPSYQLNSPGDLLYGVEKLQQVAGPEALDMQKESEELVKLGEEIREKWDQEKCMEEFKRLFGRIEEQVREWWVDTPEPEEGRGKGGA